METIEKATVVATILIGGSVLYNLTRPMVECHGIYGDVNESGIVNIGDAIRLGNYLTYPDNPTYALTPCQKITADVDGDGVLTQTDVDIIFNYASYGTKVGKVGEAF